MKKIVHWTTCLLMLVTIFGLTGCHTTDQAHSGDTASVEISGHIEAEIRQAVVAVFLANGYEQANGLTFEKKAAFVETAAYGGWSANAVWIRIRANITCPEQGHYVLGCNVFKVRDRNQGLFEEEQRYTFQKRDECKRLLDQIKTRLDSKPAQPESR